MAREELIDDIYSDIELLRSGQIHELVKGPGKPKCSTLADRIEEKLDRVINSFESEINENVITDRDRFKMLYNLLKAVMKEISELSKKQPDALMNAFKVAQVNRILIPLKEAMQEEQTSEFLELVAEPTVDTKAEKSRHTYSDVAVILSQYHEACSEFWNRHFPSGIDWLE